MAVFVEEGKAGFAINLLKIVAKLFTTTHEGVELVIAETYAVVVGNGAAVVHLIYISPHARAQAHGTGLTGGVGYATGEVEGVETLAGGTDGLDFSVCGGIVVEENTIVAAAYDDAILYDDTSEGTAMAVTYAILGFEDGFLHVFIHFLRFYLFTKGKSTKSF